MYRVSSYGSFYPQLVRCILRETFGLLDHNKPHHTSPGAQAFLWNPGSGLCSPDTGRQVSHSRGTLLCPQECAKYVLSD